MPDVDSADLLRFWLGKILRQEGLHGNAAGGCDYGGHQERVVGPSFLSKTEIPKQD